MSQKMQLRNGKTTGYKIVRCCAHKARKSVPYAAKSCVSRDTHDSFSIDELRGMLTEFALRYENPIQRAYGLCEIYEYLNEHVESIKDFEDGLPTTTIRKQALILIRDAVANVALYPKDAELQEAIQTIVPKLVSFLEKTE
jgi:hypothetical protein